MARGRSGPRANLAAPFATKVLWVRRRLLDYPGSAPTGAESEIFHCHGRVVLPLEPEGEGYRGLLDIPAQSVEQVALEQAAVSPEGALSFVLAVLAPAKWSAEPAGEGDYACTFSQGPATLACTMRAVTAKQLAGDVEAAFDVLVGRDEIDNEKIGLLGHSEGEVIAPMVAARRRDVAFIVLLAGPGVPGDDVLVQQVGRTMQAAGAPEAMAKRAQQAQRKLVDIATKKGSDQKLRDERQRPPVAAAKEAGRPEPNPGELEVQVDTLMAPWFRCFLRYDPRPALKKVKVPVLALIGSLDTHVDAAQNIPALKKALRRNKKATVEELPGLNHLFQPAKTGGVAEYDAIETTIDPVVLERVSTWSSQHVSFER